MLILSINYHPQATMKAEVSLLSIPCPPSFVLFKFHRRKNKRGKHFSINTKWNAMQQLYVVWSSHFIKSSNIHSYFRLIHHKYLCACIPTKSLSSFVSSSITYLTKQCFFFFISNAQYTETCNFLPNSSIPAAYASKHENRDSGQVYPQRKKKELINKVLQVRNNSMHECVRFTEVKTQMQKTIFLNTTRRQLLENAPQNRWARLGCQRSAVVNYYY